MIREPASPAYVTGIDAGGSGTRLLVVDAAGRQVCRLEGPPANLYRLGAAGCLSVVDALVREVDRRLPGYAADPGALCMGLAGLAEGVTPLELQQGLRRLGYRDDLQVHNDVWLLWHGVAQGAPAIVLLSGTGSVALGVNGAGELRTAGGLGYLYDDPGSGFDLGRQGIRAAIDALRLGRPGTCLAQDLLEHYGLRQLTELPDVVATPDAVAAFAPRVHEAAIAGDAVARALIEGACLDLDALLEALMTRGGFDASTPIALAGGCLQGMVLLREGVQQRLRARGLRVVEPRQSALQAAIALASGAAPALRRPARELIAVAPGPRLRPGVRLHLMNDTAGLPLAGRVTHLAIGAHPDDLEIIGLHGIAACRRDPEARFGGVVVTHGGGSPRGPAFAHLDDAGMAALRAEEQLAVAREAGYELLVQLGCDSAELAGVNESLVAQLHWLIESVAPQVLYLHNPFDRHSTHRHVLRHCLAALARTQRPPPTILGVEVWRSLDWLPREFQVRLDVGDALGLQRRLLERFRSQVEGGKRYDRALPERSRAQASLLDERSLDAALGLQLAVDLSHLAGPGAPPLERFTASVLERFEAEIRAGVETPDSTAGLEP